MTKYIFSTALLAALALVLSAGSLQGAESEREFNALLKYGNDLYRKGDYRGASLRYRRALEIKKDPLVYYNLGNALYQVKDRPGAVAAFVDSSTKYSMSPSNR